MLQRLHALQKEMHEDFLKKEAIRTEENQRHFSMFGSPCKNSSPGSAFTPTKGKNLKSPIKGDQSVSPSKKEKSPTKNDKSKSPSKGKLVSGQDVANGQPPEFNIQSREKLVHDKTERSAFCEKKPIVSCSQTPGSSKDECGIKIPEKNDNVAGINNVVKTSGSTDSDKSDEKCVSASSEAANNIVNSDGGGIENSVVNNRIDKTTEHDSDSEGEERHDDITVEERKARLKRTMSPSFYSDDVYRLKRQRTRDDNFICRYFVVIQAEKYFYCIYCSLS